MSDNATLLGSYHLLSCLLMEWQHRFHHHILALCTFFQDFHLKKKTKTKAVFFLINLVLELVVSLSAATKIVGYCAIIETCCCYTNDWGRAKKR